MTDRRCPCCRKVGEWQMGHGWRDGEAWEIYLCTTRTPLGRPLHGYTTRQTAKSKPEDSRDAR